MSLTNPIPRGTREVTVNTAPGQTQFGPLDFLLYDAADLELWLSQPGADYPSQIDTSEFSVTPAAPATTWPAFPQITLTAAQPAGSTLTLRGVRVPSRTSDVTRAGALQSQALERELDKQVVTEQELRRDISRISDGIDHINDVAAYVDTRKSEVDDATAAAIAARDVAVSAAGTNLVNFSTTAAAVLTVIPAPLETVITGGYAIAGDLGAARYKRVAVEPTHDGKFQSADGAWWEIAEIDFTPEMFGAKGDGVTDDGPAFRSALKLRGKVYCPASSYLISGTLQFAEGALIGAGNPTSAAARKTTLIFRNIPANSRAIYIYSATVGGGDALLENLTIWGESWDGATGALGHGIEAVQLVRVRNVSVARFKKENIFVHWTGDGAAGRAPYGSLWENVSSYFSGRHGILVGVGAGLQTFINPIAKWNGSPDYGVAPSVAGNFDGMLVDSTGDGNPGNAWPFFNIESLVISGGDCSYNSRYGWNFAAVASSNMTPGYAEGNLSAGAKQINIGGSFYKNFLNVLTIQGGITGVNFGAGAFNAAGTSLNINQVYVSGENCGIGVAGRWQMLVGRNKSYVGYSDDGANLAIIRGDTDAANGCATFQSVGNGYFNFIGNPVCFNGIPVLGPRKTGWELPTGAQTRTSFDPATVSHVVLAEHLAALIVDLYSCQIGA